MPYEPPVVWEYSRGGGVTGAETSGTLPQVLEIPSGGVMQPQDPQDRRVGHYLRDLFTRRHVLQGHESQKPCDCQQPQNAPSYGQPATYRPQRQTPFQQAETHQGVCDSIAQRFGMTWDQFCQCAKCRG